MYMMNILFIFLRRDTNGMYVSHGKVNPIRWLNVYIQGCKELWQRDNIFFKVYYLTDLPLITLCKGLVEVKSFLTSEVLFHRYTAVYLQCKTCIRSSNYGEGINAGSILFLFHWLPVSLVVVFVYQYSGL